MSGDRSDDLDDALNGGIIETANGSFYKHYERGLTEFLGFAAQTAADAIASGRLQQRDLVEVQRGLENLRRPIEDLMPLLEKRIDGSNPTFFDECTIESIWNALGAVFLIAQHSGFTDSAKVHAQTLQSRRGGKSSGVVRGEAADKAWRSKCLEQAVVIRSKRPKISTSKLGTELWEQMPKKPGKPADPRTVSAYLTEMENESKLPRKL